VAIARDVFDFLDGAFRRLFAEYCRETGSTTGSQKSFFSGLVMGLNAQLEKAKKDEEQKAGLVLVEDFDLKKHLEAMKLKNGQGLARGQHDPDALKRGIQEGKKLNIRRSLEDRDSAPTGKTLALGCS
jgi:hypothetical protein